MVGDCPIHHSNILDSNEFVSDIDYFARDCPLHDSSQHLHLYDHVNEEDLVIVEDIDSLDGIERYIMNQKHENSNLSIIGQKHNHEWEDKFMSMALNFHEYHTMYQFILFWRTILKANVLNSIMMKRRFFNLLRKISILRPIVRIILTSRTVIWWDLWRNQSKKAHVFLIFN